MKWVLGVYLLAVPVLAVELTNENILTFAHINDVFRNEGIGNCGETKEDVWKKLLQDQQITPCEPASVPSDPGAVVSESGVVVNQGFRTLHDVKLRNCQGKLYWLRWSYDRLVTTDGPVCGFEFFLKTPRKSPAPIVGMALDNKGSILPVVPKELAFDKDRNKTHGKDLIVRSGQGCFECHPTVSKDYSTPKNVQFWNLNPNYPPHQSAPFIHSGEGKPKKK